MKVNQYIELRALHPFKGCFGNILQSIDILLYITNGLVEFDRIIGGIIKFVKSNGQNGNIDINIKRFYQRRHCTFWKFIHILHYFVIKFEVGRLPVLPYEILYINHTNIVHGGTVDMFYPLDLTYTSFKRFYDHICDLSRCGSGNGNNDRTATYFYLRIFLSWHDFQRDIP